MKYIGEYKSAKDGRHGYEIVSGTIQSVTDIRMAFSELYEAKVFNNNIHAYAYVEWEDAGIISVLLRNENAYSILGKHLIFILKNR